MNLLAGVNLSQVNIGSMFDPRLGPKYHWKKAPEDSRDRPYQLVNITLPTSVDLRPYCSPVEDQGNLGSCTGNAIAGCIEYVNRRSSNNTKTHDVSRLFIYYEERVLIGAVRYDSGAYIKDGIKVCYTKGAPTETLWPYNINKFATKPTTAAYSDALNRKLTNNTTNTTVNITGVTTTSNQIKVSSTTGMIVNGAVRITGTTISNLTARTYYVKSIGATGPQKWITVSTTMNGAIFNVGATANGTMACQIIPGYKKINDGDVNAVKNALASGFPVVMGFTVYDSFEYDINNNTGMMPYPNIASEQVLGGHAVTIVGYNDNLNGGRFIVRNSWGTGWGDGGYFYMPYQVVANRSMSNDFWIVCTVVNP